MTMPKKIMNEKLLKLKEVLARLRISKSSWYDGVRRNVCSGQVISDSLIGFFDVDSRSKALGDKLPSFECSLRLL